MSINGNYGENFSSQNLEIKKDLNKKETIAYYAFDNGNVGMRIHTLPLTKKHIVISEFKEKTLEEINRILDDGDFSECRRVLTEKIKELGIDLVIN